MKMPVLENLLDWVVPDPGKCRDLADELAAGHRHLGREALARRAMGEARRWAAATGGATGLAANPITMLPAALADMSAMLRLEGQMAGVIAALLDPGVLPDRKAFDADVISIVFPGAVSQALRAVGVRAGQRLTRKLIQRYVTESFVKEAAQVASKYLAIRVAEKAVVSKTVPLVGAGIGAAWNWLEMEAVGRRAIRYYTNRAIAPDPAAAAVPPGKMVAIKAVVRRMPWRRPDEKRPDAPPPPPPTLPAPGA